MVMNAVQVGSDYKGSGTDVSVDVKTEDYTGKRANQEPCVDDVSSDTIGTATSWFRPDQVVRDIYSFARHAGMPPCGHPAAAREGLA